MPRHARLDAPGTLHHIIVRGIERRQKVLAAIGKTCEERQIDVEALRSGSRVGPVSRTRAALAIQLVKEYGLSLAEAARQLGISTSAIAKVISRTKAVV
ncbi:helix-turn-helix domain-containing protein [Thermodesulfobacteriota bacterium]